MRQGSPGSCLHAAARPSPPCPMHYILRRAACVASPLLMYTLGSRYSPATAFSGPMVLETFPPFMPLSPVSFPAGSVQAAGQRHLPERWIQQDAPAAPPAGCAAHALLRSGLACSCIRTSIPVWYCSPKPSRLQAAAPRGAGSAERCGSQLLASSALTAPASLTHAGGRTQEFYEWKFTFSVSTLGLACVALGALCLALFPCLSREDEDCGCDCGDCECGGCGCGCDACQEGGCEVEGGEAAGGKGGSSPDYIMAAGYTKL